MSIKPKQPVPALSFPLVGGGTFDVASAAIDKQLWIVVYRGKHCPVCHEYLETLNGLADDLKSAGISAVAVSADPADRGDKTKDEWDIDQVTLGYGLTEPQMRDWDLFVSKGISDSETDLFAEPGLFVVNPDRTLYYAAVNSMPFGRPDLKDMLEKMKWVQEEDYPARGEA